MSNSQHLRFRVGLFVLGSLILLGGLTTIFGGFPDLFRKYDTYTVVFDDAPGVAPGTPVRRSGQRIGQVKSVDLDSGSGKVRVRIAVEKKFPLFEDDQAMLVQGFVDGDASIDFSQRRRAAAPPAPPPPPLKPDPPPPDPVPGVNLPEPKLPPPGDDAGEEASQVKPDERIPAKPGKEFEGVRQPDIGNVLKSMAELVEPTQESLRLIRQSLQRLEKTAPLADETLREYRDLARETRRAIPELRKTNDEIHVTARNWGKLGERLDLLVQNNQDKLVKVIEGLNESIGRVNNVLSDENQKNLTATLKNVRTGTDKLESIAKNTDELMKEGRVTVKRLNETLTKADDVLVNLQQATKPLAERSDTITKNLEESSVKLNRTLTDVRELLRVLSQGDGTMMRLLKDPALYNHLDDVICNVNRLMPRVDRALKDLEVFADKLARHPESIGLGGAIRPSAGLKEAPSAPSSTPYWPTRK